MREKILVQGSLIRAAYGVLALLFPKQLFAAIGMKNTDPEARYVNRLFGGRDLLVAAATVDATRRGNALKATIANLACEATDSVSLVEELRLRGKLERTLIVGLVLNVIGYATWIRALIAAPATVAVPVADEPPL
jgi:hypothetical protein